jgi:DNA-binding CsgD family transcriptional regulator
MRSEIYNELVKPLADCRHCLGVIVDVGGLLGVMGFHRPTMASNFSNSDRRQFQRLVPHIQRSLQIGQKLEHQNVMRRTALSAIDSLSFGLIVVDAAARPLLMNRMAESYLGPGRGMLGGNSGRPLRAESAVETAAFHRLVHEATASPASEAGAMQLSRAPPQAPLMLLVSPLVGRQATVLAVGKIAALIVIHDPAQKATPPHRVMRDLFGLTAAEADLAGGLALGARLEEIAEEQGVKLSTIRTQLKSLLSKTDTDRQASLVRLLTRLSTNGG